MKVRGAGRFAGPVSIADEPETLRHLSVSYERNPAAARFSVA